MRAKLNLHAWVALLVGALFLNACGTVRTDVTPVETSELLPFEKGPASDLSETDLAATIATLELDGGSLTFLDLGEGHVGIAERGPADKAFVSGALLELDATALEVYLAFKPDDAEVPQPLQRAHALQSSESPRALRASLDSLSPQGLEDPGSGEHDCDYYDWKWDWVGTFEPLTDYYPVGSGHILPSGSHYTFYPGAHVYKGTNINQLTYLGACSRDRAGDVMTFEIHRWLPTTVFHLYPTPPTVTWSWKKS